MTYTLKFGKEGRISLSAVASPAQMLGEEGGTCLRQKTVDLSRQVPPPPPTSAGDSTAPLLKVK